MMIGLIETCSLWEIMLINIGCVRRNTQCYLRIIPTSSSYSYFILLPQTLCIAIDSALSWSTALPWSLKSLVTSLVYTVHVCWVKHFVFEMMNTKCECDHSERSAFMYASFISSVSTVIGWSVQCTARNNCTRRTR
jgi:hypothetical protein